MTLFELVGSEIETMIWTYVDDGKIPSEPITEEELQELVDMAVERLNYSWVFNGDQAYVNSDIQDFIEGVHDHTFLDIIKISADYVDPITGEGADDVTSIGYTMQVMYRNLLMVMYEDETYNMIEDEIRKYVTII